MPILYKLIIAHNGKPRYSPLEFCHNCGSQSIILNKDHERSKNGVWQCMDCDASVGAHSDGNPQGYMADINVRRLRFDFHKAMEVLMCQKYTYPEICNYLEARLGIEPEHMHSAWMTAGELVMAIRAMNERARRPHKNRPYRKELYVRDKNKRNKSRSHRIASGA